MKKHLVLITLILLADVVLAWLLGSQDNPVTVILLFAGAVLLGYLCVRDPIYSLAFVIIAAPLYQYRFDVPLIPVHLTVHRLFLGVTVVSLILSLNKRRSGNLPGQKHKPDPILIFLLFWLTLELIATGRSNYSEGINRLFPRSVNMLTVALVYIIVRDRRRFRIGVVALLLSAVIPIGVGLWQLEHWLVSGEFSGIPFQEFLENNLSVFSDAYKGSQATNIGGIVIPRFASVMVDTNYFALFLSSICLLAISARNKASTESRRWRAFLTILFFLSLVMLPLTFSRSGLFGLLIGGFIYFGLRYTLSPGSVVRLLMALGVVWLLLATVFDQFGLTLDALIATRFEDDRLIANTEVRFSFLEPAIEAFFSSPIIGVGAANVLSFGLFSTSHTTPFTILAEYGLIGFTAYYAFITWLLWQLYQIWKHQREAVILGLLAGLISLLSISLLYDHFLTLEINWVIVGLALASVRIYRADEESAAHQDLVEQNRLLVSVQANSET